MQYAYGHFSTTLSTTVTLAKQIRSGMQEWPHLVSTKLMWLYCSPIFFNSWFFMFGGCCAKIKKKNLIAYDFDQSLGGLDWWVWLVARPFRSAYTPTSMSKTIVYLQSPCFHHQTTSPQRPQPNILWGQCKIVEDICSQGSLALI